jgi:microcystin degradation protein MlrC
MTSIRLAIGGVKYESNSFGIVVSPEDLFIGSTLRRGDGVFLTGASSEYDGALRAAAHNGVDLVPLLASDNTPGGTADHSQYLKFKYMFMEELSKIASDVDGAVLVLHGAMTTTEEDDADAHFVGAVREILGDEKTIVVTHDLHAAPSPRLIGLVDALVGYKTCPHVDLDATGARAVGIASAAVRGEIHPAMAMITIPMLTPAEGHDTIDGPMAREAQIFAHLARELGLLDASIFMCQPWLDTARSSWRLTAVFDRATVSRKSVENLLRSRAQHLWGMRESLSADKLSVAEALEKVRAYSGKTPLLVADGGDSPTAGSAGDSTDLLKAIVSADDQRSKLAIVADPAASSLAAEAGIGAEVTLTVGGSLSGLAESITVSGTVIDLGNGQFNRILPPGPDDLGQTATVLVGSTTLFITSKPPAMLDQTVYRHAGIELEKFDAIQVKSAGGFRAHWADLSQEIVYVDTRGASDSSLASLPFTRVVRPLWPFDDITSPVMEVIS